MASANQTSGLISTTFGGVPRVWRGPAMHWTAPQGGTRTSTERPGASEARVCSVQRTAIAMTVRPAPSGSAAHWRSALKPSSRDILRAIKNFLDDPLGEHRVSNLHKAAHIRAQHIISGLAILFRGLGAAPMHPHHDLPGPPLGGVKAPAIQRRNLLHFQ